MIDDKNKRIKELEAVNRELKVVLSQFVAHGKEFLKTHVSKRYRLAWLIGQAERALGR